MPSLTVIAALNTALQGQTTIAGVIGILNTDLANGFVRWRKSGVIQGSAPFGATPFSENNGEIVAAWNNGARSLGTTDDAVNSATWTWEFVNSASVLRVGPHAAYANDETLPNYLTTPFAVLSKTWRTAGQVIWAGSMRLNPNLPEATLNTTTPYRITLEDWSTGAAVPVSGEIKLMKLQGSNQYVDSDLNSAVGTWQEYGPSLLSALPELRGIKFTAKRLTYPQGGVWAQESHELMVMQIPTDAQYNGVIGDLKNVRTYLKDFKLKVWNQQGALLRTIEMEEDGSRLNSSTWTQIPASFPVPYAGASLVNLFAPGAANQNEVMRPWMPYSAMMVLRFGTVLPDMPAATRNKVPRVNLTTYHDGDFVRSAMAGHDGHYVGDGNGFQHTRVLPKRAYSPNAANALTATYFAADTQIINPSGGNWFDALICGWGFDYGTYSGHVRVGGPGGVRPDRSLAPHEFVQAYLAEPAGTRPIGGFTRREIAIDYARGIANYPGYFTDNSQDIRPLDMMGSIPVPPMTTGTERPDFRNHYYGPGNGSSQWPVFIWDSYSFGSGWGSRAGALSDFAAPGTTVTPHVRAWWSPEGEHNNRKDAGFLAHIFGSGVFGLQQDFLTFENTLMSQWLTDPAKWVTNLTLQRSNPMLEFSQRTNMMWMAGIGTLYGSATQRNVFTRAKVLSSVRALFGYIKTQIMDAVPAASTPVGQGYAGIFAGTEVSWQVLTTAQGNSSNFTGWAVANKLSIDYMAQALLQWKSLGLYDALRTTGTTTEQTNCTAVLDKMVEQLGVIARLTVNVPWDIYADSSGTGQIALRSSAQGAVEATLSTIPTSFATVYSNNTNPRGDANWFLRADQTAGSGNTPIGGGNINSGGIMRLQLAHIYFQVFCPAGTERTNALASITTMASTLKNYTPKMNGAYLRHHQIQSVPSLGF